MLTRRSFFKLGGKVALAAVAAPLLLLTIDEALTAVAAPDLAPLADSGSSLGFLRGSVPRSELRLVPLTEGVPPEPLNVTISTTSRPERSLGTGQIPVEPRIFLIPTNQASKEDPLGLYGIVGAKYTVNGEQYGDWIKFTDLGVDANNDNLMHEAFKALRDVSIEKLSLIEPRARFRSFDMPAPIAA